MSSRRPVAVFGVAMVVLAWACSGSDPELTEESATDGGLESAAVTAGDGAPTTVDLNGGDAACSSIPGNLLVNGSFETAGADGGIATWESPATLVRHVGGADDCEAWAELDSTSADDYAMLQFSLPTAADAGTLYDIGVSIRSLDGVATPVTVELRVVFGSYDQRSSKSLSDAWTRLVGTDLKQTDDAQGLAIVIRPGEARRLGIDRAFVIAK